MSGIAIDEPVRVRGERRNGAPAAFTWRGAWHDVRRWRLAPAGRGSPRRVRWEVHTTGGMGCVLVQGTGPQDWKLERVLDTRGGGS